MKHIFTFFSFAILHVVSAQIPRSGLIAYFQMNGNAADSSIHQAHGTLSNVSPAADRFGIANSAYDFSGNSNSYIEFPATHVQTARYTYSLWAKIDALPASGDMAFALNIGSTGGDQSVNIANNYGGGTHNGWLGGGYNTSPPNWGMQQGANLSTSSWTHVVSVRDSNHVRLYINGVLADSMGSSSVVFPFYGNGTVRAFIGIRNGFNNPFNGKIDDVMIYNRALSQNEIRQLYNQQPSTSLSEIRKALIRPALYPNPSSGNFTIDLDPETHQISAGGIVLYNAVGQRMTHPDVQLTSGGIRIEHSLPPGIYTLILRNEAQELIAHEKILIR